MKTFLFLCFTFVFVTGTIFYTHKWEDSYVLVFLALIIFRTWQSLDRTHDSNLNVVMHEAVGFQEPYIFPYKNSKVWMTFLIYFIFFGFILHLKGYSETEILTLLGIVVVMAVVSIAVIIFFAKNKHGLYISPMGLRGYTRTGKMISVLWSDSLISDISSEFGNTYIELKKDRQNEGLLIPLPTFKSDEFQKLLAKWAPFEHEVVNIPFKIPP
jgi:hypothetical protein